MFVFPLLLALVLLLVLVSLFVLAWSSLLYVHVYAVYVCICLCVTVFVRARAVTPLIVPLTRFTIVVVPGTCVRSSCVFACLRVCVCGAGQCGRLRLRLFPARP